MTYHSSWGLWGMLLPRATAAQRWPLPLGEEAGKVARRVEPTTRTGAHGEDGCGCGFIQPGVGRNALSGSCFHMTSDCAGHRVGAVDTTNRVLGHDPISQMASLGHDIERLFVAWGHAPHPSPLCSFLQVLMHVSSRQYHHRPPLYSVLPLCPQIGVLGHDTVPLLTCPSHALASDNRVIGHDPYHRWHRWVMT